VSHVDAGEALEIFPAHVPEPAGVRRRVGERAGTLLRFRDETRERRHAEARMNTERIGRAAQHHDMGEVLDRVVAEILRHDRHGQVRGRVGDEQRIAVGLGLRHIGGADAAAGAGLVLDYEGLPEHGLEMIGDQPRRGIARPAGSGRHHDPHDP
jgi:hypothetical protein